MNEFQLLQAESLGEAAETTSLGPAKAMLLAGGTDLLAEIKEYLQMPETLVNLKSVRAQKLVDVAQDDQGLSLGALVKLSALAKHPELGVFPALKDTIMNTATPQIRNLATVGGNLCQRPRCWYYRHENYICGKKGGDTCYAQEGENEFHAIFNNAGCNIVHPSNLAPVLIALDAQFEIIGLKGTRQVAANDFFQGPEVDITKENILSPGEILSRVIIPKAMASWKNSYTETREKQSFDWSICGVSVALKRSADGKKVDDIRLVLSAVAPTPLLREDLAAMMRGKALSDSLIEKVAEAALEGATPMAQNAYKLQLVKTLVTRSLQAIWEAK